MQSQWLQHWHMPPTKVHGGLALNIEIIVHFPGTYNYSDNNNGCAPSLTHVCSLCPAHPRETANLPLSCAQFQYFSRGTWFGGIFWCTSVAIILGSYKFIKCFLCDVFLTMIFFLLHTVLFSLWLLILCPPFSVLDLINGLFEFSCFFGVSVHHDFC